MLYTARFLIQLATYGLHMLYPTSNKLFSRDEAWKLDPNAARRTIVTQIIPQVEI
jgi:hypothetical protein